MTEGTSESKKVLIILDQFEQWLHSVRVEPNAELVQALRQCDGGRVQCMVLVRDDFWMAVTRFMHELDIRLVEGDNCRAIDLFDTGHAKKVLTLFGRAWDRLPESSKETTKEQKEFLKRAIDGLAENGKIVCVRLALFAEMFKSKPWTPAMLDAVGGMHGVGYTFLEETFIASTAPPPHRLHQKAAQAVLKALLPEIGTDIKGNMRTYEDLLAASNYAGQPKMFDALLQILVGELRLITPTDREGLAAEEGKNLPNSDRERYYQLTHDYLVPSLRDWLTRNQVKSRRGRAELRLAERAALWNAKPRNRNLPALWEWANVRLFTTPRTWTPPQVKMMRKANRYYLTRGLVALLLFGLIGFGAMEWFGHNRAESLVRNLLDAETHNVPNKVRDMSRYRRWVDPMLRRELASAQNRQNRKDELHTRIALLAPGEHADYVYDSLFQVEPRAFGAVRTMLEPHKDPYIEKLWGEVENGQNDIERRFRAAAALAGFATNDVRWGDLPQDVIRKLVKQASYEPALWSDAFNPVGGRLLPGLVAILEEDVWEDRHRRTIVDLCKAYSATPRDVSLLLNNRLERSIPDSTPGSIKTRANLLAASLELGPQERAWQSLMMAKDPTLRSYVIDRIGRTLIAPDVLHHQINVGKDSHVRAAAILALGELDVDRFPVSQREQLCADLIHVYQHDRDAGVHGATTWVLRRWGMGAVMDAINNKVAEQNPVSSRDWSVNRHGDTLTVVRGPQEFLMGEPPKKPGTERRERITYSFAIASKEATLAQYLAFRRDHRALMPHDDLQHPVSRVTWHDAAAYCNWLSREENIPECEWCYESDESGRLMRERSESTKRTGYRLPTEPERECAARAGTTTAWSCGQVEDDLLKTYARFLRNSSNTFEDICAPVGSYKPNDLGLFDMSGNVAELCHEPTATITPAAPDQPNVQRRGLRAAGGGSYGNSRIRITTYATMETPLSYPSRDVGFRVVRTLR